MPVIHTKDGPVHVVYLPAKPRGPRVGSVLLALLAGAACGTVAAVVHAVLEPPRSSK